MKIQILVDNPNSWIIPYLKNLVSSIKQKKNCYVKLINSHEDVESGDVLCLLSCEKKFNKLNLNKYNLVVHESDLPEGKGWSPLTWQVIEGKRNIPITLFEANSLIDSGDIYEKINIKTSGYELIDELRFLQVEATTKLILNFIEKYPNIKGEKQKGKESFYRKRTKNSSELNILESIKDQFNLLRVCDNERYPAFFIIDNVKYLIKIYKDD
jgi:methionyl-tRNA formyltransferase